MYILLQRHIKLIGSTTVGTMLCIIYTYLMAIIFVCTGTKRTLDLTQLVTLATYTRMYIKTRLLQGAAEEGHH